MTAGNARHGRRDNGLFAAEYVVVGDVDPRVGEHLLDVLGNRGIAAYLQPSADQHPVTRLTTLPGRPIDRLFVDRRELSTAREFYDIATADTAGPIDPDGLTAPAATTLQSSSEFEAAWASIVASFDSPPTGDRPPWPPIEDDVRQGGSARLGSDPTSAPISPPSDPTGAPPPDRTSTPTPPSTTTPPGAPTPPSTTRDTTDDFDRGSLLDGLDTFGRDVPDEEDDEDYHPPPPPPLPRFAGSTVLAVVSIFVGIAVIIYPGLLPVSTATAAVLGGACLVAGGAALIARLRSGDDDPDDPDDGAVV